MTTVVTFELGPGADEVWMPAPPDDRRTSRTGRAVAVLVVAMGVLVGGTVGVRGADVAGDGLPSAVTPGPTALDMGPCESLQLAGQQIAQMCRDYLAMRREPVARRVVDGAGREAGS